MKNGPNLGIFLLDALQAACNKASRGENFSRMEKLGKNNDYFCNKLSKNVATFSASVSQRVFSENAKPDAINC